MTGRRARTGKPMPVPTPPLPRSCASRPRRVPPLTRCHAGAVVAIDDWACEGHDSPAAGEWHDGLAVVFPRRGAFALVSGPDAVVAHPAVAILWPGQRTYRIRHVAPGGDACTVLRPHAEMTAEALHASVGGAWRDGEAPRAVPLTGDIGLRQRRLLRAARDGGDALALEEGALDLLEALRPLATTRRHGAAARHLAREADACLAAQWRSAPTLAELARALHTTPWHLARQYRAATGTTLHRTVLRLRLHAALERLGGGASLSTIAHDTGFASHAHFTGAFRREFACTPSAARDRLRSLAPRGGPGPVLTR